MRGGKRGGARRHQPRDRDAAARDPVPVRPDEQGGDPRVDAARLYDRPGAAEADTAGDEHRPGVADLAHPHAARCVAVFKGREE